MVSTSRVLVFLLAASALVLQGCGGGGGGNDDPQADASLLAGNYYICIFGARDGMPDFGSAVWGATTLDGMGALTGMTGLNSGGGVTGPLALNATYTVAADRQTTFLFSGTSGYAGWTDAAGSIATAGSVTAGEQPGFLTLFKLGSGFADADLQGDWFMLFSSVSVPGAAESYWGSITLDALAEGGYAFTQNSDGTLFSAGTGVAIDVAADGQADLTIGAVTMQGAVHASKNLVVLTGSTTSTLAPYIAVLIRKTSGASAATLSGAYQLVGIERDGGGFASIAGSAVADGMGSLTATFTKNTEGVLSNAGPDVVSYNAAADGALTVDPMGDPLEGGFSSGGEFAAFAGPTSAMTNPRMYLLMRR